MTIILLLFSCTSRTDDSGLTVVIAPCDVELTGAVPETENRFCENGRCFISAGQAILGRANPIQPDQCPPHKATISEFSISETEITVQEWESCVDNGDCEPQPELCRLFPDTESKDVPVTCIDWFDAQGYCEAQNGRLPTEAEWELAARGREGNNWAWEEGAPSCSHANYKFVTAYCEGNISPVRSYDLGRSRFGLYDMSGNVWEWTADWYDAKAYQYRVLKDPTGPEDNCHQSIGASASECTQKVIRGGAWDTTEGTITPYSRSQTEPSLSDVNIGFRCVFE